MKPHRPLPRVCSVIVVPDAPRENDRDEVSTVPGCATAFGWATAEADTVVRHMGSDLRRAHWGDAHDGENDDGRCGDDGSHVWRRRRIVVRGSTRAVPLNAG